MTSALPTPPAEPAPARPQTAASAPPCHCVLDIEASGFGRSSYPIEVGYALGDGRTHCTLVRPAAHWTHWDDSAEQVHHIARDTLLRHGRSALEVAHMLNRDLAGKTVYCDGWAHDYTWLATLFEEAGLSPRFHLESVGRLLDDTRLAGLHQAQQQARTLLGLSRHRASADARALQWALAQLGSLPPSSADPGRVGAVDGAPDTVGPGTAPDTPN